MNNNAVTHASVRLKGTENIYDPVICQDLQCAKKYMTHMHCPFCVRTEFFTDPVILKAHYRVKHVDKGIEYAGLKIVRCCDHCDIVGSIKGSKEIKGAHWHCYKCKNGFNRRDEALKHYRTHFRTPHTEFQIQITQDVNQMHVSSNFPSVLTSSQSTEEMTITASTERADGIISVNDERCLQVSVAANETVDSTNTDLPNVMVLPSESSVANVVQVDGRQEVSAAIYNLKNEIGGPLSSAVWSHPRSVIHPKVSNVQPLNELQESDAQLQIQQLQIQIQQLQHQVQKQAAEIEELKKRESELVDQLQVNVDDRMTQLLEKMKQEHEELLHRQLLELRSEYLRHIAPSPSMTVNPRSEALVQPMFILKGSDGQPIQIIEASKLAPASGTLGFATFAAGPELLSSILPAQETEGVEEEEEEEEEEEDKAVEHMVEEQQDALGTETVQNFIVAADDISEYVSTEDGGGEDVHLEMQSEDVSCNMMSDHVVSVSLKRQTDHLDSTAKRGRV